MANKLSFRRLSNVLTEDLGLELHVRGAHHIFTLPGSGIMFNLQPYNNDDIKPYQLAQLKAVLVQNGIVSETELEKIIQKVSLD